MTRVSIIIPTLDRRELLSEAVETVREQTYDSFECLVVDGGSTDGTCSFLEGFDDEWLRVIEQDRPGGPATARNIGINTSDAEFVLFLDDDDLLYPYATNQLVTNITNQSADCAGVFATKHIITRNGRTLRRDVPSGLMTTPSIEHARAIGGPSGTIFRRRALKDVDGFDESFEMSEDLDLYLTLLSSYSLYGVDTVCCVRRLHEGQISNKKARPAENTTQRLIDKHHDVLDGYSDANGGH